MTVWTYRRQYVDRQDPLCRPYPNHAGDIEDGPYPGTVTWADPTTMRQVFPDANAIRNWGWDVCLMVTLPSGIGIMVPDDQLVLDERKMPLYIIVNP